MALNMKTTELVNPAALLALLGAEVEELPAAPAPVPDDAPLAPELDMEPAVVEAAEPAVLVRVAMLMVVLRAMAVPVPMEAAEPPTTTAVVVVVGMVPFMLAMMELTVLLSEAMAELTEALDMDMELVAEADDCADIEPPVTPNWPE